MYLLNSPRPKPLEWPSCSKGLQEMFLVEQAHKSLVTYWQNGDIFLPQTIFSSRLFKYLIIACHDINIACPLYTIGLPSCKAEHIYRNSKQVDYKSSELLTIPYRCHQGQGCIISQPSERL